MVPILMQKNLHMIYFTPKTLFYIRIIIYLSNNNIEEEICKVIMHEISYFLTDPFLQYFIMRSQNTFRHLHLLGHRFYTYNCNLIKFSQNVDKWSFNNITSKYVKNCQVIIRLISILWEKTSILANTVPFCSSNYCCLLHLICIISCS